MLFVDRTYFYGDLAVANSEPGTPTGSKLNSYIAKYEPKILNDILGSGMYKSLRDGLLLDPIDVKWLNLRDGDSTTDWKGLIYVDDFGNKRSLIANFVYFYWLRDKQTITTDQGEKIPSMDGGKRTSVISRQVTVWNDMAEQVDCLFQYLQLNATIYPQYLDIQLAGLVKYVKMNEFFTI